MYQRLESPLSPSTFRIAVQTLGLRYEQIAYDLDVSEKTVEGWSKKSYPSERTRNYIQNWLNRVDEDATEIINQAVAKIENGATHIILVTAWSGKGLKTLEPKFHDYPATVHMALIGRVFMELNARDIPCRVEYAERQHLETRQREPELHFIEQSEVDD